MDTERQIIKKLLLDIRAEAVTAHRLMELDAKCWQELKTLENIILRVDNAIFILSQSDTPQVNV